jgi:uncharacterized protein YndB with AHSA1/START domain
MTERQIVKTVEVAASPEVVWRAWATVEGVKSFFAPDAKIELRPGGAYEIYFDLGQAEGLKWSEGCKVLSFVPSRMLSFTWGAPPKFQGPQGERSLGRPVFDRSGEGTRVTMVQLGWKDGGEEDAVYQYFDRIWPAVLESLVSRFSAGPVDWGK